MVVSGLSTLYSENKDKEKKMVLSLKKGKKKSNKR